MFILIHTYRKHNNKANMVYLGLQHTAIPIITEVYKTAFNGSEHQFTTGKPLKT
jgi:hypothetical protein